jgi:hypothetical protein
MFKKKPIGVAPIRIEQSELWQYATENHVKQIRNKAILSYVDFIAMTLLGILLIISVISFFLFPNGLSNHYLFEALITCVFLGVLLFLVIGIESKKTDYRTKFREAILRTLSMHLADNKANLSWPVEKFSKFTEKALRIKCYELVTYFALNQNPKIEELQELISETEQMYNDFLLLRLVTDETSEGVNKFFAIRQRVGEI